MLVIAWGLAAGFFLAAIAAVWVAGRARRGHERLRGEIVRLEEELDRILKGLILAEEAATRILAPGQLSGTVEKIAKEAVELFEVEGVCVLVKPPDGQDEPTGLCWGRVPEGMGDVERPIDPNPGDGFGSILSLPIRLHDSWLGEFRLAEAMDRPLSIREVHVARLLAQLIAIAAQYRIQRKLLERAEEDKSRFILATTHDLRAPVSTIQQLSQVMRDGYAGELSEKGRELAAKIGDRAEQLLALLSDMLDLAREGQGTGRMRDPEPVSLSEVFDAQAEAARAGCEARGITLSVARPDSPLIRLAARGDLENIIGNLFSNAVKYTPRGGKIDASLEDAPGGVVFRVRDSGIGIPKEALPRLFTEYFRASNAKEMARHGTGLGLALVQKLVRKYGGRIRVDSTEGRGSVFEVFLPPT
ncbi:MAG: hypothetical protein GF346_11895 [Candidatus Eisenbacteria bacterium]|nr:hypothetical protein [Candidatus Latescibacterota bacterium]MBD3303138.1 hypothetical protein [Candidatus Eisenbacteria bacterium]